MQIADSYVNLLDDPTFFFFGARRANGGLRVDRALTTHKWKFWKLPAAKPQKAPLDFVFPIISKVLTQRKCFLWKHSMSHRHTEVSFSKFSMSHIQENCFFWKNQFLKDWHTQDVFLSKFSMSSHTGKKLFCEKFSGVFSIFSMSILHTVNCVFVKNPMSLHSGKCY